MKSTEAQQKQSTIAEFSWNKKRNLNCLSGGIASYHFGQCCYQLSLEQGQFPNGVETLLH